MSKASAPPRDYVARAKGGRVHILCETDNGRTVCGLVCVRRGEILGDTRVRERLLALGWTAIDLGAVDARGGVCESCDRMKDAYAPNHWNRPRCVQCGLVAVTTRLWRATNGQSGGTEPVCKRHRSKRWRVGPRLPRNERARSNAPREQRTKATEMHASTRVEEETNMAGKKAHEPKPYEIEQQQREARESKFIPLIESLGQRLLDQPRVVLYHFVEHRPFPDPGLFKERDLVELLELLCDALNVHRLELFDFAHRQHEPKRAAPAPTPEEPTSTKKRRAGKPKKPEKGNAAAAKRNKNNRKRVAAKPGDVAAYRYEKIGRAKSPLAAKHAKASKTAGSDVDARVLDFCLAKPRKIGDMIRDLEITRSHATGAIRRLTRTGKLKAEGTGKNNISYLTMTDAAAIARVDAQASAAPRPESSTAESAAPTGKGYVMLSNYREIHRVLLELGLNENGFTFLEAAARLDDEPSNRIGAAIKDLLKDTALVDAGGRGGQKRYRTDKIEPVTNGRGRAKQAEMFGGAPATS